MCDAIGGSLAAGDQCVLLSGALLPRHRVAGALAEVAEAARLPVPRRVKLPALLARRIDEASARWLVRLCLERDLVAEIRPLSGEAACLLSGCRALAAAAFWIGVVLATAVFLDGALAVLLTLAGPFLAAFVSRRAHRWMRPLLRPRERPPEPPAGKLARDYARILARVRDADLSEEVRRLYALAAVMEAALQQGREGAGELFAEAKRRALALARRGVTTVEVAQALSDRLELARQVGIAEDRTRGLEELSRGTREEASRIGETLEEAAAQALTLAAPVAASAGPEARGVLEETAAASRVALALREIPGDDPPVLSTPTVRQYPRARSICAMRRVHLMLGITIGAVLFAAGVSAAVSHPPPIDPGGFRVNVTGGCGR